MASYTDKQKNELTKQYEPLINKLTGQFYTSVQMDWDSIKSMAYEGFALALNKYDESKSSMSFMSLAAFEMRNNIMTRLTEESRTVKLPFEEQKRRKESGEPLFNSVSIDRSVREDDDIKPREIVMGMYETARFADGDVFSYLYERLEEKFPQRECDMFYMSFGLKGFEDTPNQDIAKKFGVSEGLVSQKKRKIIDWIRTDRDLCEMLSNLV
jgi:RNA polymerase sigma factor (sigma-70 family)